METTMIAVILLLTGELALFTGLVYLWKSKARKHPGKRGTGLPTFDSGSLEEVGVRLGLMEQKLRNLEGEVQSLKQKLAAQHGLLGFQRYNAFAEQGPDLSFSLALVDEKLDGVVLTSLYNRGTSHIYAKPLSHGDSAYPLSEEERSVIQQAKRGAEADRKAESKKGARPMATT